MSARAPAPALAALALVAGCATTPAPAPLAAIPSPARLPHEGIFGDSSHPDRLRASALRALAGPIIGERQVDDGTCERLATSDSAPAVRAMARALLVDAESFERMFEPGPGRTVREHEWGRGVVAFGPGRRIRAGAEAIEPIEAEGADGPDPSIGRDLTNPEPRLRAWGAERLAESGADDAVPRLVALAKQDPSPLVRVAAIDLLGTSARLPAAQQAFEACARLVAAGPTLTERLAAAQALWGLIVFAPDGGVLADRALAAREALLAASPELRRAVAAWVQANRHEFAEVLAPDAIDALLAELRR